jgi:hypothetical protein
MTHDFVDESPTMKRKREMAPHSAQVVMGIIPLDVVPILAVAGSDVPWKELGELATRLLKRIDGRTDAMSLVMGAGAAPSEGIRELAVLVDRGLVRWGKW